MYSTIAWLRHTHTHIYIYWHAYCHEWGGHTTITHFHMSSTEPPNGHKCKQCAEVNISFNICTRHIHTQTHIYMYTHRRIQVLHSCTHDDICPCDVCMYIHPLQIQYTHTHMQANLYNNTHIHTYIFRINMCIGTLSLNMSQSADNYVSYVPTH